MALRTDYGEGGGHGGAHEEVIARGLGEGGAWARGWHDAVEEGRVLDTSARHGQQDLLGDWMWGEREIKGCAPGRAGLPCTRRGDSGMG